MPSASIVIPTHGRPGYLDVALASIAPQARAAGTEVVVVLDGPDPESEAVAQRHGARTVAHSTARGLNAARNTGIEATDGDLVAFVDDDVEAPEGWLAALLAGAGAHPEASVLGGPIRARLEACRVPMCGRESPPVTALDLGPEDRVAERVWGANLAVRRAALELAGPFDESLPLYGDEDEWQGRVWAAGGRVVYVAAAGLDHRRARPDATLAALCRAARARGRSLRRFDVARDQAPTAAREVRVLAGCLWHTARRRCGNGLVMAAHSAGRLAETLRPSPAAGHPDFLSGRSGTMAGRRAQAAAIGDVALDAAFALSGRRARLARAARDRPPRRRVLVIGVDRPERPGLMDEARAELARSRHDVEFAIASGTGGRGKFENLNELLTGHPAGGHDWLLVIDDDVKLPAGFLDRFLFCAERFGLRLAQPAHRLHSHAAWDVTRRHLVGVARQTGFVEIGPVTAFAAETFDTLLPFPDVGMGWGLELHWAALARERGWPIGVVDAVPIRHVAPALSAGYDFDGAVAEASAFLADHPYVPAREANRTLVVHRTW